MTFALAPWIAWLLIAAAAATTAAVFTIRPRARRQVVASLILWTRVVGEAQRRSLWQRIRWAISMLVTAGIAAAIAAALAGPAPRTESRSSGRALLVLDSSWSMRARTPSGATRWARAIAGAHALASGSAGREIAIATTAEGVVQGPTTDLALIHRALDDLQPSGGAEGSWPQVADAASTHFFTDGAVARPGAADITVHSVFTPAANVAVTAFDVEPAAATGDAEISLDVSNFAAEPQVVHVTVTRGAGVLLDQSLSIRAGASHRESMAVPLQGEAGFRAHVSAGANALDVDDDAVAWLWSAKPLRVGVVGTASRVPALLARDATMRVSAVDPAAYADAAADVWIFDRWLPADPPTRPAFIIDPPASPWLGARGAPEDVPAWRRGTPDPLLDGVDMSMARLGRARSVARPALRTIAASERDTPLISVEDTAAGRYVVLHFSTEDASFDATPAFPILVGNVIDWLGRPERGVHRQSGPVSLSAATRRVIAPNGQSLPLLELDDRVTTILPGPGLYLAETVSGESVLSVNLGDPSRSNLLASSVAEDRSGRPESGGAGEGSAWWIYLVSGALMLAGLEWVTWRRRITV